MGIPILTYHSQNIDSNNYAGNDHIAFANDLRLITELGWKIIPLTKVVEMIDRPESAWANKVLAICFDDGSDFDYCDLPHPVAGMQRSMLNIMHDFKKAAPQSQPDLHATAFVIASPDAREIMDRTCMLGTHWWNHGWWPSAVASGLMDIGSHSWDHCHITLPEVRQRDQRKGDFWGIDTDDDAAAQIDAAFEFINSVAPNVGARLFAYPYGHAVDFLVRDYFPRRFKEDIDRSVIAAFSTYPKPISIGCNRWNLPRYVCGHDWKSSADLTAILRDAS